MVGLAGCFFCLFVCLFFGGGVMLMTLKQSIAWLLKFANLWVTGPYWCQVTNSFYILSIFRGMLFVLHAHSWWPTHGVRQLEVSRMAWGSAMSVAVCCGHDAMWRLCGGKQGLTATPILCCECQAGRQWPPVFGMTRWGSNPDLPISGRTL